MPHIRGVHLVCGARQTFSDSEEKAASRNPRRGKCCCGRDLSLCIPMQNTAAAACQTTAFRNDLCRSTRAFSHRRHIVDDAPYAIHACQGKFNPRCSNVQFFITTRCSSLFPSRFSNHLAAGSLVRELVASSGKRKNGKHFRTREPSGDICIVTNASLATCLHNVYVYFQLESFCITRDALRDESIQQIDICSSLFVRRSEGSSVSKLRTIAPSSRRISALRR